MSSNMPNKMKGIGMEYFKAAFTIPIASCHICQLWTMQKMDAFEMSCSITIPSATQNTDMRIYSIIFGWN